MITIPINLSEHAQMPTRSSIGAAAYDLYTASRHVLRATPKLVNTGVSIELPLGYVGMICSRSGLALNDCVHVLNSPGLIDSDYRGEIGVILYSAGMRTEIIIPEGTRIAQLMICKHEIVSFNEELELTNTARGSKGFGSTGKGELYE
jgi:dUTP pyrophosphatase